MSRSDRREEQDETIPRMQRVEELFIAALDLPTAQRSALLDRECRGDDELRREVDELLAAERGPSLGFPEPSRIKLLLTRKLQPKGFATTERAEPGHGGNAALEESSCGPVLRAGNCIGQYEFIRQLGRGGMGEVYLARDLRLGRLVALKLLAEHRSSLVERFLAEARTTARCHHENIVVIYEVGERHGHPFMVLEYLEGQTLRQWLREHASNSTGSDQRAALPPGRAVELMLPVVRALAYAHERGIVHRDLKPENIMLTRAGMIKVLDFGIAKLLAAPASNEESTAGSPAPGPVHSSALIGTLPYMSPEQMNVGAIDHRSDLWAVGIMLFELVTGQHPVPSRSMRDLMRIAEEDTPMPSVRECMPDLGPLAAVIDRCLIKYPAHRTPDARVLLAELEALAPGRRSLAIGENGNPFAGLAAFQEADADRFFGRDRDIEQIITELRSRPLVAVVGASGVGKSSLVRAGVIPALKRSGEGWDACVVRPGRSPLAALAGVLAHLSDTARTTDGAPEPAPPALVGSASQIFLAPIIERLRTEPGYLGARLRARASSKLRRILVFVDQFEELYTLGVPADERCAFLACLAAVADDAASPLRVLLSMRSDFLGRITEDRHLSAEVTRGLVLLPAMGREGLLEALMRPLELREFRFESSALVERMLDALDTASGALPLLQFTAARLWDLRDTEHRMLTEASYEQLGGVAGALASHADAVLAGMPGQDARLARALFLRLVTPERTRALITMAELRQLGGDSEPMDRVLNRLMDARLLAVGRSTGSAADSGESDGMVEIIHESLISTWPLLGHWLIESEEDAIFLARLRSAARDWERSGHAAGLLWTGEAAGEARAWHQRYQGELAPAERRYLGAVLAATEHTRRMRRRVVGGLLATATAVAMGMSWLAWQQTAAQQKATASAARAEQEAARARDATRMAALRIMAADPTTQMALVREIEDTDSPPPGAVDEAKRLLHAHVARAVFTDHDDVVWSASFSADGQQVVSASMDKTVRVWNADGSGAPVVLRGHDDAVISASFSPDGKQVVSASRDRTVRVWNADGSGAPIVLRGHDNGVNSARFSPDGRQVVSASMDKAVRVWNADGSGVPVVLRGHDDGVWSASFSPDGRQVVSASMDKTVRVWNADGSGVPVVLRGHDDAVRSASFSPDGQQVVSASMDKTMRMWNADGSGALVILRGHDDGVWSASFSPDGRQVVSASMDRTVRMWNADGSGAPVVLRGHDDGVWSASFSPDGRQVISASRDKTVRIWNADHVEEPQRFQGHTADVYMASFSADGR